MDFAFGSWSPSDKFVCAGCVHGDGYLAQCLTPESGAGEVCSYCGRQGAVELDVLLELVENGASRGWIDADDVPMPYVSAEGGYVFPTRDLWDVQSDFLQDYIDDGELLNDVLSAFDPKVVADWCDDNELEEASDWDLFSNFVRHHARYMFWTVSSALQQREARWWEERPMRVLESLGKQVMQSGLTRTLPESTGIWRARGHVGASLDGGASPSNLGTIPRDLATSANRMSAPGIALFYGSLDRDTAAIEATRHGDPTWGRVTLGQFRPSRALTVLDLTKVNLPEEPSPFRHDLDPVVLAYDSAMFLRSFVESVARPTSMSDAIRGIEYVPTQVFTEFVLHALGSEANPRLSYDGIVYPSAEVPGGANVVINVPNERCVGDLDPERPDSDLLQMVLRPDSVTTARRTWSFE